MPYGIIRLGGVVMLYTQFDEKLAKCKNVRIESDVIEELFCDIKKLTKAGVIKIVYSNNKNDIATQLESKLVKAGYSVQTISFADNIFWEELQDSSEGIVLLGSYLANYYNGSRCIILADDLNLFDILHKEYYAVLVDEGDIKQTDLNTIAGSYGKLMSKLIGCFDYKLSCISYSNNNQLNIAQEIEGVITDLFLKNYLFNYENDFIRDLTATIINVGLLESMLTDVTLFDGYNICNQVVKDIAKSNNSINEFAMLVGWYIVNTIKSLTNKKTKDLFLPCDIMKDIEYVAEKSKINKLELLKIADKIKANEYIRLSFISNEYSKEINKYLDKIYPACINAMKNFRRIYYDAGLILAGSITLHELSQGVLQSVIFNPNYSYLKMFRVLGVA